MRVKRWLSRVVTETANGYLIRNREVIWEKPHGKGTSGRNRLGADFWLYDLSEGYPPEKRWRLTVTPRCPDGRRFCSEHDERPYWGPDYNDAKRAAQEWANQRWPIGEMRRDEC